MGLIQKIMTRNICALLLLSATLSSCALFTKNQDSLSGLGLIEYQPDPYEVTIEHPDPIGEDQRNFCIERWKKNKYRYYNLFYKSDGLKVKAVVALPPNFDPKVKHPLLVFNRGGNRNFGYFTVCDIKMMSDFAAAVPNAVVITAQLRGSHESEGEDEFGGRDMNDITNLIKLFEKQSFVDEDKKYLIGWSRGGMMAYMLLKKQIDFKAAAIIAAPTDLFLQEEQRSSMAQIHAELIPDYEKNRQAELQNRSVIYWADKINRPLIIIQGAKDWRVPVEHGRLIRNRLQDLKKDFLYKEYEDQDHDLRKVYFEMINEIKNWFLKY